MSRHAAHSWHQQIEKKAEDREKLIVRLKLRIARATLEGKPTDGLRLMLKELES